MVELAFIVYILTAFFAYIGWLRKWKKELISLAGIALAIFALHEFRPFLIGTLLENLPESQQFFILSFLFVVIVYFAYQTRGFREEGNADVLQQKALGAIVGGLNGYLISGTLWYFLDISYREALAQGIATAQYPLAPLVTLPPSDTISFTMIGNLPQYVLTSGDGNLLSLLVVVLFIIVLVLI
jgi:hypothetical protein